MGCMGAGRKVWDIENSSGSRAMVLRSLCHLCELFLLAVGRISRTRIDGGSILMSDPSPQLKNRAFKISDCRIWAEIYYLDSPTNYREYLHAVPLSPSIPRNHLIMLDARSRRSCAGVNLWLL